MDEDEKAFRLYAVYKAYEEHENDLLSEHVSRLQSDPNAIEHQAREELHYTRPNEVIYTLPGK